MRQKGDELRAVIGPSLITDEMNSESVMEPVSGPTRLPDVSLEERVSSELVKRIRKLRWIGMEREAQRLQTPLCGEVTGTVLARPHKPG